MCYPLIFNWDKIPCSYSSGISGWSDTHYLPGNLIFPCSKNATFTKLSICNHARTRKEDPIHPGIKEYLETLYVTNDIEESTCTEQENQSMFGIHPGWVEKISQNG